ncbi:MAG: hypothetical protein IJU70_06520 [Lentisphaeria bacterium]|nr:hypothetical protein [Lentisphaeria bacterium]
MISFSDTRIPSSMAPLDCMESMLLLEMGTGTLESTLAERWQSVPLAEQVSAAFWPSSELLRRLAGCKSGFLLAGGEGRPLAAGGDGSCVVTPDADSFFIRHPWDLLRIQEEIYPLFAEPRIQGVVREGAVIDGIVRLGKGSVLLPGVFIEGTAVIGRNCRLGPNCYLRGNTFIGDDCHIGQAVEVKNAILMHHTAAGHLSYIGDSIVCPDTNFGAGTIISNFRHDGGNHKVFVDGVPTDTGRRKFGAVIGRGVHTGIHTAIYPGRKIGSGAGTLPGEVVRRNIGGIPD